MSDGKLFFSISPGLNIEVELESFSVAFQLDFAVGSDDGGHLVFVDDGETQGGGEFQLRFLEDGGLVEVDGESLAEFLFELLDLDTAGGQELADQRFGDWGETDLLSLEFQVGPGLGLAGLVVAGLDFQLKVIETNKYKMQLVPLERCHQLTEEKISRSSRA